ncbi:hypothetical protein ACLOJK_032024 [Asimina triloba]
MSICCSIMAAITARLLRKQSNQTEGGGEERVIEAKKAQPAHVSEQQMQTVPRFAPELDGLHCFETIIPR